MDIATLLGIGFGLSLTVITILLAEGVKGFTPFLNVEAFCMVMGGTMCALFVHYPMKQVLSVFKVLKKTMLSTEEEDMTHIIASFVDLSKKARTDGFLALDNDVRGMKNDFLRRGVQMVVDGLDKEFIANMLETEIDLIRERHKVGQEIFSALGTYAPAFGIIGTVLGMIMMLSSISDVSAVPRRMALALAAAFFGLGSGYLIFLPMAGKLRRKSEEELLVKEIIIRGVLLLQSGAIPSRMEENLKAYLEPSKRALIKSTAAGGR
jgi:chemotaxis protein MotA